jgi:hypothetical protein
MKMDESGNHSGSFQGFCGRCFYFTCRHINWLKSR